MPLSHWLRGHPETTRGRMVAELRSRTRTVEELARALGLTDNAVRAHLSNLERDRIVERRGVRRTGRKPAHTYGLTAEAESLFSKAYVPLLGRLLDVLCERTPLRERRALLRAVGRRLRPARTASTADLGARVDAAAGVIDELGGVAEVERGKTGFVIRSQSCPLGAVVEDHPEVCEALAGLVAELTEAPTRARCSHEGGRARCSFEVAALP